MSVPVDTEVLVSLSWIKTRSSINERRIGRTGLERVQSSPLVYESTLTFSPLSMDSDDEGEYVCSASLTLATPLPFVQTPPIVNAARHVTIDSKTLDLSEQ